MTNNEDCAARFGAARDTLATRTTSTALWATPLFVLLWSSGAIAARLALDHATPFALLTLRFALVCAVLGAIGLARKRLLPPRGERLHTACTGLLLIGGYAVFYFLALDHGMTPGVLATVLGAQPMLTLLLTERRASAARLGGLALAFAGLAMVVFDSLLLTRLSPAGVLCALASLASMTVGAILQKRSPRAPAEVLPLQYGASLVACLLCLPFQPFAFEASLAFAAPLLWLALGISIGATLLFYRLIQAGNLVNVTSLFYLVPAGTAALDYLLLGNRMTALALAGMGAVLAGLGLVFRGGRNQMRG
ncbi:DMT family transporter [Cupriavidus sp. MP-37]|uniref:DMT family transporter n=1 Tax=Cupriavidus sp. MP-37 TaxID=2884455 RepID=UPI001D0BD9A4|nr:DMT family transporter [Cupriavidus sp. MP-37]UDM52309.1 DMT family transporter [Cupriavidus sp. MP-37]